MGILSNIHFPTHLPHVKFLTAPLLLLSVYFQTCFCRIRMCSLFCKRMRDRFLVDCKPAAVWSAETCKNQLWLLRQTPHRILDDQSYSCTVLTYLNRLCITFQRAQQVSRYTILAPLLNPTNSSDVLE